MTRSPRGPDALGVRALPSGNAAERRVAAAFATGRPVDLAGAGLPVRGAFVADLLARPVDRAVHPRAALRLANAQLAGRLDLRHLSVEVPVSITGSTFAQAPDLTQSRLQDLSLAGSRLPGLEARLLEVRGDLVLRECRFDGRLDVRAARIAGSLDLDGARIASSDGVALLGDGLDVAGALTARYGFETAGDVLLMHCRVGSQLNFEAARLRTDRTWALHLGGAQTDSLWLTFAEPPQGRVRLSGVRTLTLFDDPDSWPRTLDLVGCSYQLLIGRTPAAVAGTPSGLRSVAVRERLDWLVRSPDGYSPQPYEELAAHYRRAGQEPEARTVLLQKERDRRATYPWARRLPGYAIDALVGYGYRTWRAALWILAFWVAGTLAFMAWPSTPRDPATAPVRDPALQALDLLLPIVDLGQDNAWRYSGPALYVSAGLVLAGWTLTTAAIAGMSRLLSR